MWRILGRDEITLADVDNGRTNVGPCVYHILNPSGDVVYVGKTAGSFRERIRGHLSGSGSLVGEAIVRDIGLAHDTGGPFGLPRWTLGKPDRMSMWRVRLMEIEGSLDEAEQYDICRLQPEYNRAFTVRDGRLRKRGPNKD